MTNPTKEVKAKVARNTNIPESYARQLKEAKIGEGILLGIIWNDAWDLSGEPDEVKEELGLTDEEYNYLKRTLNKSYFEK